MGAHLEDAHARMAHIEPLLYDPAKCAGGKERRYINRRKARYSEITFWDQGRHS